MWFCSWHLSAQTNVFVYKTDGYAIYRIPAICRAPNGDLLAFCEGRVSGGADFGKIDLVFKQSVDNGRTWSKPVNITDQVHRTGAAADWRSYANTPGHALQITKGKYKGRIYVAANHSAGAPQKNFEDYQAHGFYTDDHGERFPLSASVSLSTRSEAIINSAKQQMIFRTETKKEFRPSQPGHKTQKPTNSTPKKEATSKKIHA